MSRFARWIWPRDGRDRVGGSPGLEYRRPLFRLSPCDGGRVRLTPRDGRLGLTYARASRARELSVNADAKLDTGVGIRFQRKRVARVASVGAANPGTFP